MNTEYHSQRKNFAYCMLHPAVIKADRATTNIRIVNDGSANRTTGRSLNDDLDAGPNLHLGVASLLMNFGQRKVVIAADEEKAFLQIVNKGAERIPKRQSCLLYK